MRSPNDRLHTISCLADANSSRSRYGSPRSSRTVHSSTTLKCLRIIHVLCSERSRDVLMPVALSLLLIRWPTPQTSSTGTSTSSLRCRSTFERSTTPPVCRCHYFAAWLTSFASVLVWTMPTPTVRYVHCKIVARIFFPNSFRLRQFLMPVRSQKASSMV